MPEQHGWIMPEHHDAMIAGLNEQIASSKLQIEALWKKEHPPMGPILKLLEHISLCENRLLLLS